MKALSLLFIMYFLSLTRSSDIHGSWNNESAEESSSESSDENGGLENLSAVITEGDVESTLEENVSDVAIDEVSGATNENLNDAITEGSGDEESTLKANVSDETADATNSAGLGSTGSHTHSDAQNEG